MSALLRFGHLALGLSILFGCSASVDDDIPLPPSGEMARVRVAHLSPDAPAVDFCVAAAGSGEFKGPVLAGAGALNGIAYGHVTKYLDVGAMQYDVRLVNVGANDCSRGLGPDTTNLPALPAGASATIAATGKIAHGTGTAAFTLRAYVDDASVPSDQAKLRFIHASPGTPNVDVGLGGGLLFTPVFRNTAYGDASPYLTTPPFDGAELSARATGTTSDVIAIKPAALPAGKIATAFAIGELAGGEAAKPLAVLLCVDNAEHGLETECNIVGGPPERARVRVAHLSPDAPAVDVCIAKAGGSYPAEPLFASFGSRAGLAYPQVTTYLELPAGAYDVRIVLASETTCANRAVPDTNGVALAPGLTATVGAIGLIGNGSFRLGVFADAASVASGKGKIRFIHASPGTPAVNVGISAPHGFTTLFSNVSFGNVGTAGALDGNGYLETAPLTANIGARVVGATTDALFVPNVAINAGDIKTAIAIGSSATPHNPLKVLLCSDTASTGLFSTCAVAP